MQTLISIFAILGVATGARLTLLPYAYLADPLPVYYQSQDTRTGVHSYSYAGGPSAKEEIRGPDGVTRGSYSYVDANGFLQSVFYVADEDGFRVAATNLPSNNGNPPYDTSDILLAKTIQLESSAAREERKKEENLLVSRRKRSLNVPAAAAADQDRQNQASGNPSPQQDQANQNLAIASKSSHKLPAPEKTAGEGRALVAPVYGLLDSVLIPKLIGTATSEQSRVDVHNNIRLKAVQPVSEPVLLSSQVLSASSQQLQNSLRVDALKKDAETVPSQTSSLAIVNLEPIPLVSVLSDYNENRIQLHKNLGLEGPNRKDAVKIDATQLAIVEETPITAVPAASAVPVVKETFLPVVTAVSNQSRTQIHNNAKLEVAVPVKPTVYIATSYAQPIAALPIWAPVAQSSQYRSQIHSSEKIELAN
ncbi:uncharacterized protein LOC109861451 [Pseudomyrmex gracilis]|uniref:uncharacterized protein LOC109861451 n=1 Tax=Pseudomyrmex gracilis TaxID=219809 RepID=UPI000995CFFB|nr:uncharacterized protein LOC109861451 [Pseudomyrmex gracilis]XP_020296701.1 uncharacterized protein LOC109861451 [Pseudomyrmex gracilis]XP_020296702.1 uncharacterized protein LOC109861451 [Pseudomyrmex gracilis]